MNAKRTEKFWKSRNDIHVKKIYKFVCPREAQSLNSCLNVCPFKMFGMENTKYVGCLIMTNFTDSHVKDFKM